MLPRRLQRALVGRRPRRTLLRLVLLAGACFFLFGLVLRPAWTDGESMAPTVKDGRLHFILLGAYRNAAPERGDLVAIRAAGHRRMYLKRVLALPGERVAFEEGALLINGVVVPEPYVAWTGPWQMPAQLVGPAEYFVAGDNRSVSRQRHLHGLVDRAAIVGRLWRWRDE